MLPVVVAHLIACITLGGATSSGFMSDVLLQLFSIPALLFGIWAAAERKCLPQPHSATGWTALGDGAKVFLPAAMGLVLLLIVIAQFVPLWGDAGASGILNHINATDGLAYLGGLQAKFASLDPAASHAALAAALPSLAIFLLTSQLDFKQRLSLTGWLAGLGLLSLVVGVLQVMQGPGSPFRFFSITNDVQATGFFANRNHFAAFLYTSLVYGIV